MRIIESCTEMQETAEQIRSTGGRIGFVPTMGFLHDGHLSLITHLGDGPQTRVMSIFVNPTQFGPGEDYQQYPRDMQRDRELAEQHGIDILFTPPVDAMYPDGAQTTVTVSELTRGLCGDFRPGHFDGVTTIVTKLIHVVKPHRLVLGQKDYQQAVVCRQMAHDLLMDTEIITAPIIRDPDGLAISSRNIYLSPEERHQALSLYRALEEAEAALTIGDRDVETLRRVILTELAKSPFIESQYVFIGSADTLREINPLQGTVLLALAVMIGHTRLIDNRVVSLP
jgi:pantoate--beta-alanine ligase